jgi:hypothetical protein
MSQPERNTHHHLIRGKIIGACVISNGIVVESMGNVKINSQNRQESVQPAKKDALEQAMTEMSEEELNSLLDLVTESLRDASRTVRETRAVISQLNRSLQGNK